MTTATRNGSNGKARKSLAEQIDRLDGILHGLSEALDGAIADSVARAVEGAVHRAVESAVQQLPSINKLQVPLAAVVFNYRRNASDRATSAPQSRRAAASRRSTRSVGRSPPPGPRGW